MAAEAMPRLRRATKAFFDVALGLLEGLEAVAHGGAGLFAEFFDEFGVDLYGASDMFVSFCVAIGSRQKRARAEARAPRI